MQCPRCEAPVPPQAEFCRQCGTAMASGLRERERARDRGDKAEDELKRRRRNIFVVGAAFLFGLVVGGNSSWFGGGFDFDHHDEERRPAVIAAAALAEAYRDDAEEAEERFGDRFMLVTGQYVATVNDGDGDPDLRLRTSDPATPLGADLVESAYDEAARLRPGQIVTVGCEHMVEDGAESWLRNCTIEAVEEPRTAPAPVPAAPPENETEEAAAAR